MLVAVGAANCKYSIVGPVSGVGGQPLLSTLNGCRSARYRDNLSMGGSRAHSVIDSAWRHCHVVGCHNLPSMSLLGVWDMEK